MTFLVHGFLISTWHWVVLQSFHRHNRLSIRRNGNNKVNTPCDSIYEMQKCDVHVWIVWHHNVKFLFWFFFENHKIIIVFHTFIGCWQIPLCWVLVKKSWFVSEQNGNEKHMSTALIFWTMYGDNIWCIYLVLGYTCTTCYRHANWYYGI